MNRSELLLSLFDATGTGLEIGPSFNPLLPKAQGYKVDILDHLTADALRAKYRDAPGVDLSRIEDVDFVSDGGSIAALVDRPSHYDFCVALHVIEHTTDLLGFLLDCETLLRGDGVLVLAIPDKRYSFDMLRPRSSTGDVLQAHVERHRVHAIGKVFDELAYNCLRGGAIAWPRDAVGELSFFRPPQDARQLFDRLREHNEFIDIHAWQFTPSSFRLIVHDLAELGFIKLRERSFHDVGTGEFFMTLSQAGAGCDVDRMVLAERTIAEEAAIPRATRGNAVG